MVVSLCLQMEISNLSRMVEQGYASVASLDEQDNTVNDHVKQKEALIFERDSQVGQIVSLRNDLMEVNERLRKVEHEKMQLETDIGGLKESISGKKVEGERELKRKERMEMEMKELKSTLETKNMEIKSKSSLVNQAQEQVQSLEGMLRDQRGATEKARSQYDVLNEYVQKLHQHLDEQTHSNTQLLAENSQKQVELKAKEEEVNSIKQESQRMNKLRDNTLLKLKSIENQKGDVEKQRDMLRSEIARLERESDTQRKLGEAERKKQEELTRERDVLNKLKNQAENAVVRQQDLVRINENTKKNLEQEILGYKIEAQKQANMIRKLEKEREKYGSESSEVTGKYLQALDEVKVREMAIVDLQKKITDGENKLKQQQNLYEAVRSDRNLYSKNLIETQDEIQEMQRKFKIMNHQIEQ